MMVNSMIVTRRLVVAGAAALAGSLGAPVLGSVRADHVIVVRARPGGTSGTLGFNGRKYACALGRSGIVRDKHEGDGGTPAGTYPLREVRYRQRDD